MKKLTEALKDNDRVVFLAIQTVFEGYQTNTPDKLRHNQRKYDVKIPMAHVSGQKRERGVPKIMEQYRSGGTPWTVIIDPAGTVVYNNYHIEVDQALELIASLSQPVNPNRSQSPQGLPGAEPFEADLQQALAKMRKQRGQDYRPRTRHLQPDGRARYTNRLFLESSPYLLQHAHNPVNWYPWGDEAFAVAKKLNRPVLLSIGYSTCHWCHVMEEESFENEAIARYLNQHYVAIKVDREERPDIDAIYMRAVQALTGQGGWPLNVWLTPERKPFFGGTYFPPADGDRGVEIGFFGMLQRIQAAYHQQRDRIEEAGTKVSEAIRRSLSVPAGQQLPMADLMHQAIADYKQRADRANGGIAGAPKFPSSLPVRLLLRYYRRTEDKDVLHLARLTLAKMAAGGIYDHIGSGFHRYATDEQWLVPHFEKMLYDNALLALAYLEGYQVTGDTAFKTIVHDLLAYVQREMTAPHGAFYSATDADSLTPDGHREEGYFYTWTPQELEKVLGAKQAAVVKAYFAVGENPNFEGRHILHTPRSADEVARELNLTKAELQTIITEAQTQLYQERRRRPPPLRDPKILTAWNGLMISAFARSGLALNNAPYIDQAVRAADFILDKLYIQKQLYRSYNDHQAKQRAYLEDYAFLTAALLDLYEATQKVRWLKTAMELDRKLQNEYEDTAAGGFYMTAKDQEEIITRIKPNDDGALPAGNSVAVLNLLRFAELTLQDSYRQRAEKALKAFLGTDTANPLALSEMMLALDFYLDKPKEIVIVAPEGKPDEADAFMDQLRKHYLPNRILIVATEGDELRTHAGLVPVARGKSAIKGRATAYVCMEGSCRLPAVNPQLFAQQLGEIENLGQVPNE